MDDEHIVGVLSNTIAADPHVQYYHDVVRYEQEIMALSIVCILGLCFKIDTPSEPSI
jgi:hypothetical protein